MSDALAAKRRLLEIRARVSRSVREFFTTEGFLEIETPARVVNPGQELHLDAIQVLGALEGEGTPPRFLITSPEYHMKRVVAAGYPRIFQICRAFRAGERGPHHEPEFTMIEWYRAEQPLANIADDCEVLLKVAARCAGRALPAPARRTTVANLMREHAGVLLDGDESAEVLAAKLRAAGHHGDPATPWDDLFFRVFLDQVEPALRVDHDAHNRATLVFDWPLALAALARRHPGNPRVAERVELYAGGLELANGFGELTDAVEQRRRFEEENAQRRARGKHVYPLDEKLLAALPSMPPTAGIALGFDRLVMWATGARSLAEVIAFPDTEV